MNVITGDIWDQLGYIIVSTNLGGVHGRGLAKQAKDLGLINYRNKDFDSRPVGCCVITIAVKGKAPETARIAGKAFSERVTAGNLVLMASELKKLIAFARTQPTYNFYLPFIGLGFGEGNPDAIMPLLEYAASEPNIYMVSRDEATVTRYPASFKPGIRRDASTR